MYFILSRVDLVQTAHKDDSSTDLIEMQLESPKSFLERIRSIFYKRWRVSFKNYKVEEIQQLIYLLEIAKKRKEVLKGGV